MDFKNYYAILGVSPQATQQEISTAYKILVKKWHPDTNDDIHATAKLQNILEAYSVLKTTEKRLEYDEKLYDYFQSHHQDYKTTETPFENCHYCNINIASAKLSYKSTFYKVTGRSDFPQRKVTYKEAIIEIPRCEKCYNIHQSGSKVIFLLPLISFAILGLILGLTIWGMWLLFLIVGIIVGGILGMTLHSIDNTIIAKEARIKKETDISSYFIVENLYRENWTSDKPTA